MIVNWDFYVRRKRINIKKWLERKNINDYNELVEVTKNLGIETPLEENVSKYFEKPETNKNDKKIEKTGSRHENVQDEIHENVSRKATKKTASSKKQKQPRRSKQREKYKSNNKED